MNPSSPISFSQTSTGFIFSFKIFNDDCNDSLAAGYAATLFTENNIDVIFGPVCNSG